jgi:hypothetical protein
MKKLTFISFMVLAFVLGSCSKDDDEKSLEGTVWEGSVTYGINKDVSTLSFKATTFDLTNSWEYDNDEDGVIDEKGSESDSGTYTYNHPNGKHPVNPVLASCDISHTFAGYFHCEEPYLLASWIWIG